MHPSIERPEQLKGKAIGVPSLGTGGIPLLRAYLKDNGVDPDNDVKLIPVGIGAPAMDAIKNNRVQAAMYWLGMVVIFENMGAKFRYFRAPDWDTAVDYTFTALQSTIDKDPQMVEAIARGANKATVFAMANPDCVRKLHWARWPNTKPSTKFVGHIPCSGSRRPASGTCVSRGSRTPRDLRRPGRI